MRITRLALGATTLCLSLWAQAPAPAAAPEFEVASVKPSPAGMPDMLKLGLHVDGALVRVNYFSLRDYIRMAYKVRDYAIQAPEWMMSQRFDIQAKLPSGATKDQVPQMLQKLLEDRFELKFHKDKKEFPVYALVVAKGGPKVQALPPDPEHDLAPDQIPSDVSVVGERAGATVNFGHGASFSMSMSTNKIEGKRLNMLMLADMCGRFVERPVVDETNLKGVYDFSLTFTPEDFRTMMIRSAIAAGVALPPEVRKMVDGASDAGLMQAVGQLGLKLEAKKSALDIMVIDSARKVPTEN